MGTDDVSKQMRVIHVLLGGRKGVSASIRRWTSEDLPLSIQLQPRFVFVLR